MTMMRLSSYLFDQLWQRGVRHIFGLPGDFALNLFEAVQADGRFALICLSHEPSVGFAADGAARATGGLGVCCVTYGAGGLNMVNPVACAYAEESSVVVLSGGPGRAERQAGSLVHHEVKSFDSQFNVYREVTEYAAILDDAKTAAQHIVRALEAAEKLKRPVYLEVPRDMVGADIETSADVAHLELKTDEGAVDEAVAEIVARLRAAEHPVLIVGVEVHRFRLREAVVGLAESLGVPVASSFLGRGVFPTRHPQFVGTYLGVVSPDGLRDIVESSDCVLLLGERISDTSLGVSADRLSEKNLILCVARDVYIGHHRYQDTPLEQVLLKLTRATATPPRRTAVSPHTTTTPVAEPASDDARVTIAGVIDVLNSFVDEHPDVPLVTDTGDCLFAAVEIRTNECIAPAYYATMGFAVPAALGLQVATARRPLVLVGDGAFQMTGPEIAHAASYGCNPLVVVLNNGSWEMLQAFVPGARYNSTVPWPFARLAELWGAAGFEVRTHGELRAAVARAWTDGRPALIEVFLERGDISPVLARFVAAFKQRINRPA
jgi:indolepyruvate decarboxylase